MNWPDMNHVDRSKLISIVFKAGMSARQIAAAVGKAIETTPPTRNAIIGHINRWPIANVYLPRQRKRKTKRVIDDVPLPAEAIAFDKSAPGKELLELDRKDCRFPVRFTDHHIFCGHPRIDQLSYCEHHAARVYQPS